MTKTLALLAALGFASAAAHAQAPAAPPLGSPSAGRSPEQQTQAQASRLAKELSLSPEQQAQVQQLLAAQRQQTQEAIQQAGGNRRAMGQAMRTGRDRFDGQLKAVLTADQYLQYQQMLARRRELLRERRQGSSAGSAE